MSRFLIFIGLFLFAWVVRGQYSFTGTITDCQTREPLSGATVELVALKKAVRTDAEGQFTFQDLPKGTHHFYVSQDDYKGHFFKVSLKRNEKNYIFALCKNKEIEVGAVVVTAHPNARHTSPPPRPACV